MIISSALKTTKKTAARLSFSRSSGCYAGWAAPVGQTSAQAPQSLHLSGSITYLSGPAVMAASGHSGSQAPQLMQSSVILWVMFQFPFMKGLLISVCRIAQAFISVNRRNIRILFISQWREFWRMLANENMSKTKSNLRRLTVSTLAL